MRKKQKIKPYILQHSSSACRPICSEGALARFGPIWWLPGMPIGLVQIELEFFAYLAFHNRFPAAAFLPSGVGAYPADVSQSSLWIWNVDVPVINFSWPFLLACVTISDTIYQKYATPTCHGAPSACANGTKPGRISLLELGMFALMVSILMQCGSSAVYRRGSALGHTPLVAYSADLPAVVAKFGLSIHQHTDDV